MKGLKPIICLVVLFCAAIGWGQESKVKVLATGQGPAELPDAKKLAIDDALRQAIEVGGGITVTSETSVKDFQLAYDAIYTQSAGLIESYQVLEENPNQDGFYTVRVEAIVSKADINMKLAAWKTLLSQKGNPKMMVVGSVQQRPFDYKLTAKIQGILEKRGFKVVDLEMLNENQRRDAEMAARGNLDPEMAAMISNEIGANYFVVVKVDGFEVSEVPYHGVESYTVDTCAVLKVIAADSSEIIASEVVDYTQHGAVRERVIDQAGSAAVVSALEKSFPRIAENWLVDVDAVLGAELEVVLNRFSFEHWQNLLKGLQQVSGLNIVVDYSNAEGRTLWRVTTNMSTVNLASLLKKVDPSIQIISTSKNRIEVGTGTAVKAEHSEPSASKPMNMNQMIVFGAIAFVLIFGGILILRK